MNEQVENEEDCLDHRISVELLSWMVRMTYHKTCVQSNEEGLAGIYVATSPSVAKELISSVDGPAISSSKHGMFNIYVDHSDLPDEDQNSGEHES